MPIYQVRVTRPVRATEVVTFIFESDLSLTSDEFEEAAFNQADRCLSWIIDETTIEPEDWDWEIEDVKKITEELPVPGQGKLEV